MINWFKARGRFLSLLAVMSDCTRAAFRHNDGVLWSLGLAGLGVWVVSEHQDNLIERSQLLGQRLAAKIESKWLMHDD